MRTVHQLCDASCCQVAQVALNFRIRPRSFELLEHGFEGDKGSNQNIVVEGFLCGAVGAFIDFYIGKPGQRRVRDRLEMWWLRLSDVRWGNFGRGEALFAVQVMDRIFSRRIFAALARANLRSALPPAGDRYAGVADRQLSAISRSSAVFA